MTSMLHRKADFFRWDFCVICSGSPKHPGKHSSISEFSRYNREFVSDNLMLTMSFMGFQD